VEFVVNYESFEIDEILVGIMFSSILLMGFSILKIFEIRAANKTLDCTNLKLNELNDKLHVVGQFTRHDVRNKLAIISNNLYLAKIAQSKNVGTSKYFEKIEEILESIISDEESHRIILDEINEHLEKLNKTQLKSKIVKFPTLLKR
jgi:hypothetical protein